MGLGGDNAGNFKDSIVNKKNEKHAILDEPGLSKTNKRLFGNTN